MQDSLSSDTCPYYLTLDSARFSDAQAAVTREGPVQNLVDFLEDPAKNNVFKYLPHVDSQ